MDKWRLFFSYYWTFLKHLGSRVWETRGGELMSALLLSVVTFFVSYIFKQVDALTAFQIAILALVGWLCVFALGHIIHAPVILRDEGAQSKAPDLHWVFGVIGSLIIMIIVSSIASIGTWWWVDREPRIIFPVPDASALQAEIEQKNQQIASLGKTESKDSLRRKTIRLADELSDFWVNNPPPSIPGNSNDPEKVKAYNDWALRVDKVYKDKYQTRLLGVIRAYKQVGVPTGFLESAAENQTFGSFPYSGAGMRPPMCQQDEVCQLRELAWFVDASGSPILTF